MIVSGAIEFLEKTQNADGGWGTWPARRSNTEATTLALLALTSWPDTTSRRIERGLRWLVELQGSDGGWPIQRGVTHAPWATALATLCLAAVEDHRARAIKGARWLLGHRGRDLGWLASLAYRLVPARMAVRVDPNLRAWSWTTEGFSWVEPTAYALIALKKLGADVGAEAREQIREAERLLHDRMCNGGGWNHGNSNAYGVDIPPYPETTALALIALQDRGQEPPNQESLRCLLTLLHESESVLSLSWAILCPSVRDHDVAELRRRLTRIHARRGVPNETRVVALALLALNERAWPFRLVAR